MKANGKEGRISNFKSVWNRMKLLFYLPASSPNPIYIYIYLIIIIIIYNLRFFFLLTFFF